MHTSFSLIITTQRNTHKLQVLQKARTAHASKTATFTLRFYSPTLGCRLFLWWADWAAQSLQSVLSNKCHPKTH